MDIYRRARLAIRQAMLISGSTPKMVAARLGRRAGWVTRRLDNPRKLKLNDVSDMLLACRCELRIRLDDRG